MSLGPMREARHVEQSGCSLSRPLIRTLVHGSCVDAMESLLVFLPMGLVDGLPGVMGEVVKLPDSSRMVVPP